MDKYEQLRELAKVISNFTDQENDPNHKIKLVLRELSYQINLLDPGLPLGWLMNITKQIDEI